jgi:hypothetical protein
MKAGAERRLANLVREDIFRYDLTFLDIETHPIE